MSKSMLLVEDNDQDEQLILRVFRKLHLTDRVQVVRDGQQALDFLAAEGDFSHRKHAALPAVVFLDIGLPRLNGLEVLRRLRSEARTSMLPVVMLTSSDDQRDLHNCYVSGANSFVRKPLGYSEFSTVLAQLSGYWLELNQAPAAN